MHIGLVIYGSIDTLTGGYLYDKYLVQHLQSRGHMVEILSLPWRNYCHHLLDNFSKDFLFRLLQKPFDILLQDELNHPSLFLINRILHKRTAFPIVAIVHQVLCCQPRSKWLNMFYKVIETRYLSSVDACILNSQTTQATVERLLANPPPSIVACPGGDRLGWLRSEEEIRTRAYQKGPLRLLFVGNVLPNKGLYELITVLSRIPKEMWRLTIVDSLSMDPEYVQRIQHLLSPQVLLTGALDGDALAAYLSRSHILTMPFSHEGFGIVYLEGMAYGLPAIGSSEGAVREFIQHGHNGFLVAPNDSLSLVQHLEHLYHDRETLVKMGMAALRTFHSYPTWAESMESVHWFLVRGFLSQEQRSANSMKSYTKALRNSGHGLKG